MRKRKVYIVLMGSRLASLIPLGVYLTAKAADDRISEVKSGAGKSIDVWRERTYLHAKAQFVDMKEGQHGP